MTEDEMVGWHHPLNGRELEQGPGDGDGQGSLCAAVHGVPRSQTLLSEQQQHLDGNGCCVTEHHDEDSKLCTRNGQIAVYRTHASKT